ncbi:MAG TPA: glycine cleavage system protein GcvH [Rhabdochlamydiaceae bacterium]|nr:glycine cleavage system protein GcvH [Rhabdochlamydiaceae bacterium]
MYFTDSHEWIKVEDGLGTVGVTAHAKRELGEIVYLQLPDIGRQVKAGENVVVLESTKAAADIYAPVSGEIVAVNDVVRAAPDILNESPEELGWLFQIRLSNLQELDSLMNRSSYQHLVDS